VGCSLALVASSPAAGVSGRLGWCTWSKLVIEGIADVWGVARRGGGGGGIGVVKESA
jgi:hypothetical protein